MARKKTVVELRADLARVFFHRTPAAKHYGFEEAMTILRELDAKSPALDECFGGSMRGGMYRHDLRTAVAESVEGADKIILALRAQKDTALELLTEFNPADSLPEGR